jgi:tRNA (Thr-GGU) A37 N-methylase
MNAQTIETIHSVRQIGTIRRDKDTLFLEIPEGFRPGLAQLDHFSHVIVLWWAEQQVIVPLLQSKRAGSNPRRCWPRSR